MIALLGGILSAIGEFATFVLAGIVDGINALIIALGVAIAFVTGLLPSFPSPPSAPGGVIGALNWFVPLGPILTAFAVLVGLWITWIGIRVIARWVKVL